MLCLVYLHFFNHQTVLKNQIKENISLIYTKYFQEIYVEHHNLSKSLKDEFFNHLYLFYAQVIYQFFISKFHHQQYFFTYDFLLMLEQFIANELYGITFSYKKSEQIRQNIFKISIKKIKNEQLMTYLQQIYKENNKNVLLKNLTPYELHLIEKEKNSKFYTSLYPKKKNFFYEQNTPCLTYSIMRGSGSEKQQRSWSRKHMNSYQNNSDIYTVFGGLNEYNKSGYDLSNKFINQ